MCNINIRKGFDAEQPEDFKNLSKDEQYIYIINKYYIDKQITFAKAYAIEAGKPIPKDNENFNQSAISDMFKRLNIVKKNGYYEYQKRIKLEDMAAQAFIAQNCSTITIKKELYTLRIKTNVGTEKMLCDIIYKKFTACEYGEFKSDQYFAIIPAYGSVVVLSASEKKLKSIRTYISDLITKGNNLCDTLY